jgi:hypothetical protein
MKRYPLAYFHFYLFQERMWREHQEGGKMMFDETHEWGLQVHWRVHNRREFPRRPKKKGQGAVLRGVLSARQEFGGCYSAIHR